MTPSCFVTDLETSIWDQTEGGVRAISEANGGGGGGGTHLVASTKTKSVVSVRDQRPVVDVGGEIKRRRLIRGEIVVGRDVSLTSLLLLLICVNKR